MATMPPSNSPMRQQRLYSTAATGNRQASNDLQALMDSMRLEGGADALSLDEVANALQRQLNINTGDDDRNLYRAMAEAFVSFSLKKSNSDSGSISPASAKENDPRVERRSRPKVDMATVNAATITTPLHDSTPLASNATPLSTVEKKAAAMLSEPTRGRGRTSSRSNPRVPRGATRSRTPDIPFFRRRSKTPVGRRDDASTPNCPSVPRPAREPSPNRARSASPFSRLFRRNSKQEDVSPPNPASRGGMDRSRLPPTPVRPVTGRETEQDPTTLATPQTQFNSAIPSPPSAATLTSPDPIINHSGSLSPMEVHTNTYSPSKRGEQEVSCTTTGIGKMRRKITMPIWNSAVAETAHAATTQPPVQPAVVEPTFKVNLSKKNRFQERLKSKRLGLNRSQKQQGPAAVPTPLAIPVPLGDGTAPGVSQTESAEVSQQESSSPTSTLPSPLATTGGNSDPGFFSPMDVDTENYSSEQRNSQQPSIQIPIEFNIGVSDTKFSSPTKSRRVRNPRKVGSPHDARKRGPLRVNQPTPGFFPATDPTKNCSDESPFQENDMQEIRMNTSQESGESSSCHTVRTTSTCSSEVDYTGRKALVSSLREEARTFYTKQDYRNAVLSYTKALKVHITDAPTITNDDNLRAVLLANRSAALFMLDAHEAAAADCQDGLKFISEPTQPDAPLSTESGPMLKAKILVRMGKGLLKLGKLYEAEQAFVNAINTATTCLMQVKHLNDRSKSEHDERFLSQLVTEAESARIEVGRCKDNTDALLNGDNTTFLSPNASSRRNNMQSLMHVNMALRYAPASVMLHETKVALLSTLKRWRELAGHCERLAARIVKSDGLFVDDLAAKNPFAGIPPAKALHPTFFDDAGPAENSTRKLTLKAAAEAVVRLPPCLLSYYFRALRLEERYSVAISAGNALAELMEKSSTSIERDNLQGKFVWLSKERDKLNRTTIGKDRGDSLFRDGDYELAAGQYTSCMTIDAEGLTEDLIGEGANAGGRLHAILHCNRAACLMAMRKFHEAVTDCTAALRIHPHYMKAMVRRARCYARLERYEEAIIEYKRWLELVEEAKKSPENIDAFVTPCIFDGPKDASDDDIEKVKQELGEVTRAKRIASQAAKADTSYHEERRKWYNDTFGQPDQGDAQQRREQWYSHQASGSRRWDSFAGKSPNGKGGYRKPAGSQEQPKPETYNEPRREERKSYRQPENNASPGSDPSIDHYSVLHIRKGASEAEIKKAYRKLALKYHPDKNSDPAAADMFRRVKLAYEVLNDTTARIKYDAESRSSYRRY